MAIFSSKNMDILTEAYYGKKLEFKKIEELLDIIIQKCYNIKNGTGDININNSKELSQIESLFEKAFGMGEMHITFYTFSALFGSGNLGPNACTLPSYLSYFKDKRNGKERIDDDLVCNVWVDTKLITELELSSGELMAIILHEVGHCYNASLFALLSKIPLQMTLYKRGDEYWTKTNIPATVTTMAQQILFFDGLKLGRLFNEIDKMVQKLIESNVILAKSINGIIRGISNFAGLQRVFKIYSHRQFSMIGLFRAIQPGSLFGYSDEKFSDSFATAYGYGKETIIAHHKLQQNKHLIVNNVGEKIPVLNIGIDFVKAANMISIIPIDPHPDSAIRMQSQINKLKRDLKDPNLDPKIKKELMDNLNEMEDYVDNVILNGEENLKQGKLFTLIYNYIMMKVFKGKADIREIFEIVYNHEM